MSQTIHMLVADDSSTCRAIFRDCSSKMLTDVAVSEARDGLEALKLLAAAHFDIAFIDLNMPGATGLETLAAMRARGDKTFTVLMSTRADPQAVDAARKLEAYDFLIKPFRPDAVQAIVHNFMRIRKPMTALLVDDSAAMRKIVSRVMGRSVFSLSIEECDGGAAAVARSEVTPFDVIFMDYNMPGMNGVEAFAHIRQSNPKARVILTSTEPAEQVRKAMGAQPLDIFLRKPFFPQQLDDAIHAAFGLRQTYQPNSMMTASTARLSPSLA